MPILDRFHSKIEFDENSYCWNWKASLSGSGYGWFRIKRGQSEASHRFSYMLYRGHIKNGMDIDHLCRNKKCCNPEHLEVVTRKENLLRGETLISKQSKKTHCPKGHPYSGDNLYIDTDGGRRCRKCISLRWK